MIFDMYQSQRFDMVDRQIVRRGIRDSRIIEAMRRIPRHDYVPGNAHATAYVDAPVSIGYGQTISQPYIVAYMTEALDVQEGNRVLEVGTGSGYQTAVLASLGVQVFSIDVIASFVEQARQRFARADMLNVRFSYNDGYFGWPQYAPFDRIIVTAAPEKVPQTLLDQLSEGGVMVIPVGLGMQELKRYKKNGGRVVEEVLLPVRFVPMVHGKM